MLWIVQVQHSSWEFREPVRRNTEVDEKLGSVAAGCGGMGGPRQKKSQPIRNAWGPGLDRLAIDV
jgi:hypothetical protein